VGLGRGPSFYEKDPRNGGEGETRGKSLRGVSDEVPLYLLERRGGGKAFKNLPKNVKVNTSGKESEEEVKSPKKLFREVLS